MEREIDRRRTNVYVEFGNDKAIEGYRDPSSDDPELVRYREAEGQRITQMIFPEGTGLQEAFQTAVTALGYHIKDGERPTWVESDSEGLQALLVEHFGITPSRNTRPKTWGRDTGADLTPKPLRLVPSTANLMALSLMLRLLSSLSFLGAPIVIFQAFLVARLASLELRTNAGADFQAAQMSGTPGAAANYIGLTANATAPAAGDTTLTGEIGSGTLIRALATYAHTTGTNTYTLTKTFTSDQSVTIAKIGVFNAATTGTMVFETLLNATATLVSGDQLQITETVTL